MKLELISNGTATGQGAYWPGGDGTFTVAGTFNSATVKLQYLGPDGATWLDAGVEATLTANGGCNFTLASGQIRAQVTGSPTGIYATATGADKR